MGWAVMPYQARKRRRKPCCKLSRVVSMLRVVRHNRVRLNTSMTEGLRLINTGDRTGVLGSSLMICHIERSRAKKWNPRPYRCTWVWKGVKGDSRPMSGHLNNVTCVEQKECTVLAQTVRPDQTVMARTLHGKRCLNPKTWLSPRCIGKVLLPFSQFERMKRDRPVSHSSMAEMSDSNLHAAIVAAQSSSQKVEGSNAGATFSIVRRARSKSSAIMAPDSGNDRSHYGEYGILGRCKGEGEKD